MTNKSFAGILKHYELAPWKSEAGQGYFRAFLDNNEDLEYTIFVSGDDVSLPLDGDPFNITLHNKENGALVSVVLYPGLAQLNMFKVILDQMLHIVQSGCADL